MIPGFGAFLRACVFLARRHGWERSPRDAQLIEVLAVRHTEAVALAQVPEDEPAAIFFTFSRDLGVLGEEIVMLPIAMTTNHALLQGLELRASRFELIDLARSISGRVATHDDVRRWFAERLSPRR